MCLQILRYWEKLILLRLLANYNYSRGQIEVVLPFSVVVCESLNHTKLPEPIVDKGKREKQIKGLGVK
jgi:hypothetical protein